MVFFEQNLAREDIEFVAPDVHEYDGVQNSWHLAKLGRNGRRWARVILDEAHSAKKVDGKAYQFLHREDYNAIHYVTATPMINTLADLINPLLLSYRLTGIKGHLVPPSSIGDIAALYQPDYNPDAPQNSVASGRFSAKGLFTDEARPDDDEGPQAHVIRHMQEIWEEYSFPIWMLSPRLFFSLSDPKRGFAGDFSQDIVRPILKLFQRRRRMLTPLLHQDGKTVFPGSDLKPCHITFEEIDYQPSERVRADELIDPVLGNQGVEVKGRPAPNLAINENLDVRKSNNQARIVNYVARKATIISFDLENEKICNSREDDEDSASFYDQKMVQIGLWKTANPGKKLPRELRQILKRFEKMDKAKKEAEAAGEEWDGGDGEFDPNAPSVDTTAAAVAGIIQSDVHGGLGFLWNLRTNDPRSDSPTESRTRNTEWMSYCSPVAMRVLHHAAEICGAQKKQLLIMCDIGLWKTANPGKKLSREHRQILKRFEKIDKAKKEAEAAGEE